MHEYVCATHPGPLYNSTRNDSEAARLVLVFVWVMVWWHRDLVAASGVCGLHIHSPCHWQWLCADDAKGPVMLHGPG